MLGEVHQQQTFEICAAGFLQAGCISCHTTNSVNALKVDITQMLSNKCSSIHIIRLFLWSPYVIGQTIIFLPCDFYLYGRPM